MKRLTTLCLLSVCAFALGCAAKTATTSVVSAQVKAAPAAQAPEAAEGGIETGGLHISEEIVRACGLHVSPAPPMFDFDSAVLAEGDRAVLAEVARCFSEGALRGSHMALIGRADPRGEGEYNMVLGESRADSVRRYLKDMGVASHRVKATTRGELDAIGVDEEGWRKDRRVDIELASR